MYTRQYVTAVVLVCALMSACSEEDSVAPPVTRVDTCGTMNPLSHTDSLFGIQPTPMLLVKSYKEVRGGELAVGVVECSGYNGGEYYSGVFIKNMFDGDAVLYEGWFYDISPNEDKVLISRGSAKAGFYELDLSSFKVLNEVRGFTAATYATSGDSYYVRTDDRRLYRLSQQDTVFIGRFIESSRALDDSTLVVVDVDGIYLYDYLGTKIKKLEVDVGGELSSGLVLWDLSVSERKILLERISGVTENRSGGLYLVDIDCETAYMLLAAPYWTLSYYPTWSNHGTFYATHYCRCDSVAMIHEYNLSGHVICKISEPTWKYHN